MVGAEAARAGGPAWTDATLVLCADFPGAAGGSAAVWSPALGRSVRLAAGDAGVLRRFAASATPAQVLDTEDPSASLRHYLRVQKYLHLGVLAQELVLDAEDLGELRVGALTGAPRVAELAGRPAGEPDDAPLTVCRCPDGALALLEAEAGRAAYLAGRPRRVRLLQPAAFLRQLAAAPLEFFGTLRGGVPYQSIYHDGDELVGGRRRALYERLALVRRADLERRSVLDLGCNIGMNGFLAVERGARTATGVDAIGLVSVAARLNAFYGRPCRFVAADLNDAVGALGRHETAFVFSLLGHLRTAEGVLRTIDDAGVRVVYVETHRDGDHQGELQRLIGDERFARAEFLGRCESSAYEDRPGRCLYRCEVRRGRG